MDPANKRIKVDNALCLASKAFVLCERLTLPLQSADGDKVNENLVNFQKISVDKINGRVIKNLETPKSVFSHVKQDDPVVTCFSTDDNKFEEKCVFGVDKRYSNMNATHSSIGPNNSSYRIKEAVVRCKRLLLPHDVDDNINKTEAKRETFSVENADVKHIKSGGRTNVDFKPPVIVHCLVKQGMPILKPVSTIERDQKNIKAIMNDHLRTDNTYTSIKTDTALCSLKKAVVLCERLSLPYDLVEKSNINKSVPDLSAAENIGVEYINTISRVNVDFKSSTNVLSLVNDKNPVSICLRTEENQLEQKNLVGNLNFKETSKNSYIGTTTENRLCRVNYHDLDFEAGDQPLVETLETQTTWKTVSTISKAPQDDCMGDRSAVCESLKRSMESDFASQDEESSDDMASVELNTDEEMSCGIGQTVSTDVPSYATLNANISEREKDVTKSNLNEGGNSVSCSFLCEHCGREFTTRSGLGNHKRTYHFRVNTFSCEVCSKKFFFKCRYEKHLKAHSTKQPFTCNYCGLSCVHKCTLIYHIKQVHLKELAVICNHCSRSFSCKETLKNHMRMHDGLRPFVCSVCGKSFSYKTSLYKHSFVHSKERRYRCQTCGNSFTEKGSLKRHLILHSGVKSLTCNECGKYFYLKVNLDIHKKIHNVTKKTFPCQHCSKLLTSYSGFKKHVDMHTRIEKYDCAECNKTFFSKNQLRAHMYRHTKPHEFICNDCGRVFNNRQHFILHTRIHTGFRPYKCKYCLKSFTQAAALNNHLLIHTGERKFRCEICGEKFRRKHHRDGHKRTHT